MYSVTRTLQPKAPFDFATSLGFLDEFPVMHGEQSVNERSLTKVVTIDERAVVFSVRSVGTVDQPKLSYTLCCANPISEALALAADDRIAFFLSLNDDLRPFYAAAEQDVAFQPVLRAWYGHHQVKFLTPFEHTCWAILSQRIPMSAAQSIKQAIATRFGDMLKVEGVTYHAFPSAKQLLAAADQAPEIIKSARKCEYLIAAARAFNGVNENWLRHVPSDDVEAWLRTIKGIGEWSARFVLIRGLGHMDRQSVGEDRLIKAARARYGHDLSEAQLREIGAKYGSSQGYWAYYLRIAS